MSWVDVDYFGTCQRLKNESSVITHEKIQKKCIIARDSIYMYAIARICDRNSGRTSGRTSGRLSVTRVDCTKTVEARIMQLSPQGSPMTLVFPRRTWPRNSKGNIGSVGAK